jgi:probable addiction module antidote protein
VFCFYAEAINAGSPQILRKPLAISGTIRKGRATVKRKASISHDKALLRELRDNPAFAAEYLRAALEDTDEPRVLLIALRRVAEARGGIAKVAKAAGVERESLYRALSPKGNPRLSTLVAVTKAVGLKLTVEAA